jgi:hypothetical protein
MENETIKKELQKFNLTDAAIAKMGEEYLKLTINGLNDVKGYAAVHKARMDVKARRVEVGKVGKELREDALYYQRMVLAEEKRILALLAPIENHLNSEEKKIDDEKDRIKSEVEAKEAARIQARVDQLEDLGMGLVAGQYRLPYEQTYFIPVQMVKTDNDEDFLIKLKSVQALVYAETKRQEEIKQARKAEEEQQSRIAAKQEAERQRLAEIERKQKEEAEKLSAERDRIAVEKKAIEDAKQKALDEARRAKELEEAKKKATADAFKEAELKAKKEAAEKELLATEAEAARKREEELKPDKEKLILWADKLLLTPGPGTIKNRQAKKIVTSAMDSIIEISKKIRDDVTKLRGD